jgi:uroporphyrin-III C-methyltransferase/precorrin-2 dehydrogenase/sirohydrochlorin ferrochelatase
MPVKTLRELAVQAVAAGLDPATPAVAVSRATRPDEARIVSPIVALPDEIDAAGLAGPILVMIGRTFAGLAVSEAGLKTGRQTAI